MQTFNLKGIFLQYYGLLSAIPSGWKTILKQEDHHHVKQPPNTSLEIGKLSCKTIYSELTNCQNFPPATAEKRLIESGFDTQERKKIYSLPFNVRKEVKLSVFQYKIVHNILYTNKILSKMKKNAHPFCTFCPSIEQMMVHLFFSCPVAESFWAEFTAWHNSLSKKKKSALTKKEIIYGVLNDWLSWSTLNQLIIIGKCFLYINSLDDKRYLFVDFITLVQEKIEIEKYISVMRNKCTAFDKKWSDFLT